MLISMELSNEISSSEDEFEVTLLNEEITSIHRELDDKENTSSDDDDSNEVSGVRRRKIRIINSECDSDSDTAEDPQSDSSEWISCTESEEIPSRIPFIAGDTPAGPHILLDKKEPLDFFKLFFTNELVNEIVTETNNYARKKLENKTPSQYSIWRAWHSVTIEEMWAFIGVIINMGTMPLANLQEYWSRNDISYIPFYSNKFTRDRFNQIFWMLHLKTIPTRDTGPRTRLQLISCFLEYINSKFLEYFSPGKEICVDESIIKFKGRISFITYNPKKPTKWCVRVYTMTDSNTGYICGILPYYGSFTTEKLIRPDLPISARIPLHLYTMLLKKIPGTQGHHMFTDRYYTSFILAEELFKLKCHLTTVAYRKRNTLVLAWKDKKVVTCLTNWSNAGMSTVKRILRDGIEINVKKPNVVINYIKYMGGVDRTDQYASTYCFLRKSLKWWRKLFFWGLEICAINSYILYKITEEQRRQRPLKHLPYVKTLVQQLTGDFHQIRDRASISTSNSEKIRLNGKLHNILTGVRKDCKVCSQRNKLGKRHQTTYYCDTCPEKPGIHLGNCYMKYHTKQNYKN
ncbi:piggyBac transposable element-derived protein 4-like isoform X2 [Vespa mandarinia]|uniref:piggyBac transposable element-derived protein 4-like isoform X2 n=1 Tax=Vespa mandarinia TaxID=7446 RepID=UPI0016156625|nr:piggyBac transposable element-derived protein 4-like isoform X2 [Vespa mandarinia]